jgi:uncharacterized protein YbjT (DUF2867 family)
MEPRWYALVPCDDPRITAHWLQAILVSSGGANPNSMMGYPQIKGELEEDFKKLDFEHCIILRPGLLMGTRYVASNSAAHTLVPD